MMKINCRISIWPLLLVLGLGGCRPESPLPRLGPKEKTGGKSVVRPIRDKVLIDQYGRPLAASDLAGRLRVADFFFTSCPSICPVVRREMQRIAAEFSGEERLVFLSHTIDPKRDTVGRLAEYARGLGIGPQMPWYFLTGDKDDLYDLAAEYWNVAVEDNTAPGGFNHSGRIVLVDGQGYIRAYAPGTQPAAVDTLIADIRTLLREE